MNTNFPEIESMSGKDAVFIRGFMQAFFEGDDSLRQCQEAGKAAVEQLDDIISVPYISKLSKVLVTSRIITKRKVSRHYVLSKSSLADDFQAFLEERPYWGGSLTGKEQDPIDRKALLDHLDEYHCVRSTVDHQLPKAAYALMMQKFKKGQYDIAFIPAGAKAGVKVDGMTYPIKFPETSND
jgi:hypothetical protein